MADNKVGGIVIKKVIPFVRWRIWAFTLSLAVIGSGVAMYFVKGGFKLGIDFAGGVRVEVRINSDKATLDRVRELLVKSKLGKEVTSIGDPKEHGFLISLGPEYAEGGSEKVIGVLKKEFGDENVEVRMSEVVGPLIGKDFARRAVYLSLAVSLLILLYIAVRFDFVFGVGAVLALIHDLFVMLTAVLFFNMEFSITVVAAILTILGYSINDTIVVYDRIRENYELNPDEDYSHLINKSITQSLSRTIITSLTTLFVVLALYLFGGYVLKDFSLSLIVGIVSGTYSSIFIASPLVYEWKKVRKEV